MKSSTRIGAREESGHAAELTQRVEAVLPAREDLVDVGLVAGVPDELVAWRIEDVMQCHGELHRPEARRDVAARLLHGVDREFAQLLA